MRKNKIVFILVICLFTLICGCSKEKVNSDKYVRNVLNIPEEYAVESIISIGYKIEERKPFDEEKLQKEKLHFDKF